MKLIRKYHRRLSIIFALPVLIIVVTGILLILRSKLGFIQTQAPKVSPVSLEKVRSISEVIKSLPVDQKKISSIIYKPSKNLYAVRTKDYEEYFIHPETLEVLKKGPKMSTLLIQLHEGSFFSKWVRDYIFFPTSLVLLFLWGTGIMLFIYPKYIRGRK
jgi:uncharacterized iron-regulated membrane protein